MNEQMKEYTQSLIAGGSTSLLVRVGEHFGCPGQDLELSPCLVPGRRWVFQDGQARSCVLQFAQGGPH